MKIMYFYVDELRGFSGMKRNHMNVNEEYTSRVGFLEWRTRQGHFHDYKRGEGFNIIMSGREH